MANLIAQRTGEPRGDELAGTAGVPARGVASRRDRGRASRPIRFFEVDPLDELERVLAVRPQRFRLQFFGVGADLGPAVLAETEIQAADASGAIREAAGANWPPRAVGLRLLDLEGREIFERLKADLPLACPTTRSGPVRPVHACAGFKHAQARVTSSAAHRGACNRLTCAGHDPPALAGPRTKSGSAVRSPSERLNSALAVAKSRP